MSLETQELLLAQMEENRSHFRLVARSVKAELSPSECRCGFSKNGENSRNRLLEIESARSVCRRRQSSCCVLNPEVWRRTA